jgi:hypothetical protein
MLYRHPQRADSFARAAELDEANALHYLAGFSILARWIDEATVVR